MGTARPSSAVRARSHCFPQGLIQGRERPSGRVARACTCPPSGMPIQAVQLGGVAPVRLWWGPSGRHHSARAGGKPTPSATCRDGAAHIDRTFPCTWTPLSDVRFPIGTECLSGGGKPTAGRPRRLPHRKAVDDGVAAR